MNKTVVHSYDIFDTILGRLHADPTSIFTLVEERYPYPHFKNLRILAEQGSNGTLEGIYRRFCEIASVSPDEANQIKAFEIRTELEQVFPIVKNMDKIQDGDILVSDSYYDELVIAQILKQAGLKKTVKVFISPNGKSSGRIWDKLKEDYQITLHLGDNSHSDLSSPILAGIPASLYQESVYSTTEQAAILLGHPTMARLMRTLRLLNPYTEDTPSYSIWNEQAQFNVPILILTCLQLDECCKQTGKDRILFTTRDCCHLIHLFKSLFPRYESICFHSSRHLYEHPTQPYVDYVKSVFTPHSIIVDGQGSGTTCIDFFTAHFQIFPDYFVIVGKPDRKYAIQALTHGLGDQIEKLNYDIQGSLIDYTEQGPVLLEPEYDLQYIRPAHACIRKCLELIRHYSFETYDQRLLEFLLITLKANMCITRYVKHVEIHSKCLDVKFNRKP